MEIDASIAARAAAVAEELQRRVRRTAPAARITWVPADRMHLTVRFIGDSDDRRTAAITAALQPPLGVEVFTLTFGGAGAFPERGRLRALWVGITAGAEALTEVEREVSARLSACGVPREDRPYRPHLTLARVRDAAGLRAAPLLDGLAAGTLGGMRVDTITLFESRLSPKGSTYVPLGRTALRPRS